MLQTSVLGWLKRPAPCDDVNISLEPVKKRPRQENEQDPIEPQESQTEISTPRHIESTVDLKQPELPAPVSIELCSKKHIAAYRRLNTLLFPVKYTEGFYKKTLNDPTIQQLTRVALWVDAIEGQDAGSKAATSHGESQSNEDSTARSQLVAAIRCQILLSASENTSESETILYVSTLGTLSPFRRYAIGIHLLRDVIKSAIENFRATSALVHVWEVNEDALLWYQNRGFKIVGKEEQYYKKLVPHAAWVLKRDFGPQDLL